MTPLPCESKWGRGAVTRPAPTDIDATSLPHRLDPIDVAAMRQAAADLDRIHRAGRRDDVSTRLILAYAEHRQRIERRTLRDALHSDGIASDLATLLGLPAADVAEIIDQHLGDRVTIVAGVLREIAAELDRAAPIDKTPPRGHAAVERARLAATSTRRARR